MSQLLLKISNFVRGIVTSYGRGEEPDGSFSDSRNLIPTKKGSLEQAHGYSTTGGLAALPTTFSVPATGSTTFNIASIRHEAFPFSLEKPVAHDGNVWFFRDNQGSPVDHFALDTWYVGTTEQTPNSGFVLIDERKKFTGTNVTISGATDHTIVVTTATTKGLSATNDYYNGWRIAFDFGTSGNAFEYALVTDYAHDSGTNTSTITTMENVGTSGRNWSTNGDDVFTLRRWFHGPNEDAHNATFTSAPGRCFESEGRVRGCGGATSSQHSFPWFMEYIDRTWFNGHASEWSYQGTYVDEMECTQFASTLRNLEVVGAGGLDFEIDGTEPTDFTTGDIFYIGGTLEYDGHQESRLSRFATIGTVTAGQDRAYYSLDLAPSRMSKRVTAINIYAIQERTGVRTDPMFIRRFDILNPTAEEIADWTWSVDSGLWNIDGADATDTTYFTYTDFQNSTGSYTQRTGRNPELEDDLTASDARHIVAWEDVTQIAGRAFFGNYYDPNEITTFVDQIRFTNISPIGIPNYDIIPSERDRFERDVSTGDPSTVERIIEQNGYLIVFKTNGIYWTRITPLPEEWATGTISLQDGIVSNRSLVRLPNGDIAFADTDQYKLIRNLNVVPLTWNIENTYYNLTNTAIVAWYDKIDRSIRFSDLVVEDSDKYAVWCAYLDFAVQDEGGKLRVPFYKLRINHAPTYPWAERSGDVLFSNGSLAYEWHKTDKTYAGTSIKPYLKTHPHITGDEKHMAIDRVELVRLNTTDAAGTLECKLYVDSSSVTTTFATITPSSSDVTNVQLKVRPTEKRMGRTVQFEYNTNATPETNGTNNIQVHSINYYGKVVTPRRLNRGSIVIP